MMGFTGTQHVFWTRICAIVLIFHAVSLGTYAAELFPYDSHTEILESADGYENCFNLLFPVVVSRQQHNGICAAANGIISFTPNKLDIYHAIETFPVADHPIIAGIWSYIDKLQFDDDSSNILQTSVTAPSDTQLYTETIQTIDEDFQTDWAFIVTWEDVSPIKMFGSLFDSEVEKNSFQIALVADLTRWKTYSIFNYHKVEWKDSPHAAGYNYGDGMTEITLPGVDDDNFVAEVLQKSNVGVPGRYVIRVDGTPHGPSSVKPSDNLIAQCEGDKDAIYVYCEVTAHDVFPKASIVLQGLPSGTAVPSYETSSSTYVRGHFRVQPQTLGTWVLTCVATNIWNSTFVVESEIIIQVFPENYNPVLTIGDLPVSNNSIHVVGQGPQLVTCTIDEPVPGSVAWSLECGDQSNQSTTDVTSVTIELTPSNKKFRCVCHVSGCSEETTQTTLRLPIISCKRGWKLYGKDRCYNIYKGRRTFTFTDASKYCRSMGGELATDILGRSQRRFIRRQIRFSAHFWVGIHDMDGDRLYKDMNGNTVTSRNAFKKGVPTRANRCVSFKRGKLFLKDCSKRQRLICQMDSTTE